MVRGRTGQARARAGQENPSGLRPPGFYGGFSQLGGIILACGANRPTPVSPAARLGMGYLRPTPYPPPVRLESLSPILFRTGGGRYSIISFQRGLTPPLRPPLKGTPSVIACSDDTSPTGGRQVLALPLGPLRASGTLSSGRPNRQVRRWHDEVVTERAALQGGSQRGRPRLPLWN